MKIKQNQYLQHLFVFHQNKWKLRTESHAPDFITDRGNYCLMSRAGKLPENNSLLLIDGSHFPSLFVCDKVACVWVNQLINK